MTTAHVGAYWDRVKLEFPRVEDAPPLPTVIEQHGDVITEFEWNVLPPLRRAWFFRQDGRRLIQLQQDRFLFNWKRTLDQDTYPSYAVVIEEFDKYLAGFVKFLDEAGVGPPTYRQFELTYVNHVTAGNGLNVLGPNNLLVDHVRNASVERFLPEPEGFNWVTSYALPESNGRLHIAAQSALHASTREKIVRLDLTARGIPGDSSESGRRQWFDMAHEWITQGFADVTSKVLHHQIWGRTS